MEVQRLRVWLLGFGAFGLWLRPEGLKALAVYGLRVRNSGITGFHRPGLVFAH